MEIQTLDPELVINRWTDSKGTMVAALSRRRTISGQQVDSILAVWSEEPEEAPPQEHDVKIPSSSVRGLNYVVKMRGTNAISCNCSDWIYRHANDTEYHCKHMWEAEYK